MEIIISMQNLQILLVSFNTRKILIKRLSPITESLVKQSLCIVIFIKQIQVKRKIILVCKDEKFRKNKMLQILRLGVCSILLP